MSCHDIGRGLNMVTRKVMGLYDAEKIAFEDVKSLLYTIRKGVHQCDGNEYEAVDYLYGHRCGKCLKKTLDLYDFCQCSFKPWDEDGLDTFEVCKDCFEEICKKYDVDCDENLLAKCKVDVKQYGFSEDEDEDDESSEDDDEDEDFWKF
jgi:hypothetical protein